MEIGAIPKSVRSRNILATTDSLKIYFKNEIY